MKNDLSESEFLKNIKLQVACYYEADPVEIFKFIFHLQKDFLISVKINAPELLSEFFGEHAKDAKEMINQLEKKYE